MNIVFYHDNGILPTFGGISRITNTLGNLFTNKGNNVWYIGAQDRHYGETYNDNQLFLPSCNLYAEENIEFLCTFVIEHQIDAIINQAALNPCSAIFLSKCKERAPFLLISCFHNSILTPIYNGAYQKEYLLKKKHLGLIFHLMKTPPARYFMTLLYIYKHHKRYLTTCEKSDAVCVLCDGQKAELLKMCGRKIESKVHVLHNCIDTDINPPSEKKDVVLWVGTFDYNIKRPDNMLRIWQRIESHYPEWNLYMLGDGQSLNDMKTLAKKLHLHNVTFMGRVAPDSYYHEAKILCVTSVHEAFSLVSIEAQRAGCVPVINNSFTSAPLIVRNGTNGLLVPKFNNREFARQLSSLMDDRAKLMELSHNALDSVGRFSYDVIYSKWMSLLNLLKNATA